MFECKKVQMQWKSCLASQTNLCFVYSISVWWRVLKPNFKAGLTETEETDLNQSDTIDMIQKLIFYYKKKALTAANGWHQ